MTNAAMQARVDEIRWYHEFDFGAGLTARSTARDVQLHRYLWRFVEGQLEQIDFHGKTVLDVGCWDGYWSFFAERRGARLVLATDDLSQNWSDGRGIWLAREILGSTVEVRQDVSVYDLGALGRTFDIVMCLGVYYHLHDPFLAFAQLRHCCHPGTLVLIDGEIGSDHMHHHDARFRLGDAELMFLPSEAVLEAMLRAAYLRMVTQVRLPGSTLAPSRVPAPRQPRAAAAARRRGLVETLQRRLAPRREPVTHRAFTVCAPFEGVNDLHPYRPPFGLARYDERFRGAAAGSR